MKTSARLGENNYKLYLIKDLYPEYIDNSENSVIRQKNLWKNEKRVWIDISSNISMNNNKYKKTLSMSLVIKEIYIKNTLWYPDTTAKMAIRQKVCFGDNVKKLEPPYTAGSTVQWCNHFGKV